MKHKLFNIKADDFGRGRNASNWRRFISICESHHIIPSIGVVAVELAHQTEDLLVYARAQAATGAVEFWNHSFSHRDFTKLSPEEIRKEIADSQEAIETYLGVRSTAFGYPFNYYSPQTTHYLEESGEFSAVYFAACTNPDIVVLPAEQLVPCELGTQSRRPFRREMLDAKLKEAESATVENPILSLQMHPLYWSPECFEGFDRALADMRRANYIPVTVDEYRDYVSARPIARQARRGSRGLAARADEIAYERAEAFFTHSASYPERERTYFLSRIAAGADSIWDVLRTIGFDAHINGERDDFAVDLGCGTGNWLWPLVLQDPRRSAVGIDRDNRMVDALSDIAAHPLFEGRVSGATKTISATGVKSDSADYVISNNTYNYVPPGDLLGEAYRILRRGRFFFLGIQRRSFIVNDIAESMRSGQWEAAERRVQQLVLGLARLAGVKLPGLFSHYESDEQIAQLLDLIGLRMLIRDFDYDTAGARIAGAGVYGGYLLTKLAETWPVRTQNVAAEALDQDYLDKLWSLGLEPQYLSVLERVPALIDYPFNAWRAIAATHTPQSGKELRDEWVQRLSERHPKELIEHMVEAAAAVAGGDIAKVRALLDVGVIPTTIGGAKMFRVLNAAMGMIDPKFTGRRLHLKRLLEFDPGTILGFAGKIKERTTEDIVWEV